MFDRQKIVTSLDRRRRSWKCVAIAYDVIIIAIRITTVHFIQETTCLVSGTARDLVFEV